uniref:Uncharacterized protein n=1 Tax=Helianthus annuus TaxID=4232 RepID=A0A251T730_HELAN
MCSPLILSAFRQEAISLHYAETSDNQIGDATTQELKPMRNRTCAKSNQDSTTRS